MNSFEKIVAVDMDEMIIGQNHDTNAELLNFIESDWWSQENPYENRSYIFRNAYFFFELSNDETQLQYLETMKHRKRLEPSPPYYSVKSIHDSVACTNIHNHYCWRRSRRSDTPFGYITVDPSTALNQHYKKCHFNWDQCTEMMKEYTQDDVMLRYKDKLEINVMKELKTLGLSGTHH